MASDFRAATSQVPFMSDAELAGLIARLEGSISHAQRELNEATARCETCSSEDEPPGRDGTREHLFRAQCEMNTLLNAMSVGYNERYCRIRDDRWSRWQAGHSRDAPAEAAANARSPWIGKVDPSALFPPLSDSFASHSQQPPDAPAVPRLEAPLESSDEATTPRQAAAVADSRTARKQLAAPDPLMDVNLHATHVAAQDSSPDLLDAVLDAASHDLDFDGFSFSLGEDADERMQHTDFQLLINEADWDGVGAHNDNGSVTMSLDLEPDSLSVDLAMEASTGPQGSFDLALLDEGSISGVGRLANAPSLPSPLPAASCTVSDTAASPAGPPATPGTATADPPRAPATCFPSQRQIWPEHTGEHAVRMPPPVATPSATTRSEAVARVEPVATPGTPSVANAPSPASSKPVRRLRVKRRPAQPLPPLGGRDGSTAAQPPEAAAAAGVDSGAAAARARRPPGTGTPGTPAHGVAAAAASPAARGTEAVAAATSQSMLTRWVVRPTLSTVNTARCPHATQPVQPHVRVPTCSAVPSVPHVSCSPAAIAVGGGALRPPAAQTCAANGGAAAATVATGGAREPDGAAARAATGAAVASSQKGAGRQPEARQTSDTQTNPASGGGQVSSETPSSKKSSATRAEGPRLEEPHMPPVATEPMTPRQQSMEVATGLSRAESGSVHTPDGNTQVGPQAAAKDTHAPHSGPIVRLSEHNDCEHDQSKEEGSVCPLTAGMDGAVAAGNATQDLPGCEGGRAGEGWACKIGAGTSTTAPGSSCDGREVGDRQRKRGREGAGSVGRAERSGASADGLVELDAPTGADQRAPVAREGTKGAECHVPRKAMPGQQSPAAKGTTEDRSHQKKDAAGGMEDKGNGHDQDAAAPPQRDRCSQNADPASRAPKSASLDPKPAGCHSSGNVHSKTRADRNDRKAEACTTAAVQSTEHNTGTSTANAGSPPRGPQARADADGKESAARTPQTSGRPGKGDAAGAASRPMLTVGNDMKRRMVPGSGAVRRVASTSGAAPPKARLPPPRYTQRPRSAPGTAGPVKPPGAPEEARTGPQWGGTKSSTGPWSFVRDQENCNVHTPVPTHGHPHTACTQQPPPGQPSSCMLMPTPGLLQFPGAAPNTPAALLHPADATQGSQAPSNPTQGQVVMHSCLVPVSMPVSLPLAADGSASKHQTHMGHMYVQTLAMPATAAGPTTAAPLSAPLLSSQQVACSFLPMQQLQGMQSTQQVMLMHPGQHMQNPTHLGHPTATSSTLGYGASYTTYDCSRSGAPGAGGSGLQASGDARQLGMGAYDRSQGARCQAGLQPGCMGQSVPVAGKMNGPQALGPGGGNHDGRSGSGSGGQGSRPGQAGALSSDATILTLLQQLQPVVNATQNAEKQAASQAARKRAANETGSPGEGQAVCGAPSVRPAGPGDTAAQAGAAPQLTSPGSKASGGCSNTVKGSQNDSGRCAERHASEAGPVKPGSSGHVTSRAPQPDTKEQGLRSVRKEPALAAARQAAGKDSSAAAQKPNCARSVDAPADASGHGTHACSGRSDAQPQEYSRATCRSSSSPCRDGRRGHVRDARGCAQSPAARRGPSAPPTDSKLPSRGHASGNDSPAVREQPCTPARQDSPADAKQTQHSARDCEGRREGPLGGSMHVNANAAVGPARGSATPPRQSASQQQAAGEPALAEAPWPSGTGAEPSRRLATPDARPPSENTLCGHQPGTRQPSRRRASGTGPSDTCKAVPDSGTRGTPARRAASPRCSEGTPRRTGVSDLPGGATAANASTHGKPPRHGGGDAARDGGRAGLEACGSSGGRGRAAHNDATRDHRSLGSVPDGHGTPAAATAARHGSDAPAGNRQGGGGGGDAGSRDPERGGRVALRSAGRCTPPGMPPDGAAAAPGRPAVGKVLMPHARSAVRTAAKDMYAAPKYVSIGEDVVGGPSLRAATQPAGVPFGKGSDAAPRAWAGSGAGRRQTSSGGIGGPCDRMGKAGTSAGSAYGVRERENERSSSPGAAHCGDGGRLRGHRGPSRSGAVVRPSATEWDERGGGLKRPHRGKAFEERERQRPRCLDSRRGCGYADGRMLPPDNDLFGA